MKNILLSVFILVSHISFSQKTKEVTNETVKALYNSLPKVDGKYEYSEIVFLDSTYKKDILYKNSKLFLLMHSKVQRM